MTSTGILLIVATTAALAVAGAVALLLPPTRRLGPRVRPYTIAERTALGRSADPSAVTGPGVGTALGRLVGPLVHAAVARLGRLLDDGADAHTAERLRQARLLADVPEELRLQEYRLRQVGNLALGAALALCGALALGLPAGLVLLLGVLGAVVGGTRWPSRVNATIDERRTRMRIELYTVNQLLAMHVRVGGGPIQAVQRVVARGRGEVVDELADVLAAHTSGMRASEAFDRTARSTPEPAAARTYRLLATGSELGADLAAALRALSEDVREARRDALKRRATKRRAAMLVPIIAILAPTMLLFIAAPIPSLIFGAR